MVNITPLTKQDQAPPKTAKNDLAEQVPVRMPGRKQREGENTRKEIVVKSKLITERSEDILVKSSGEVESPESEPISEESEDVLMKSSGEVESPESDDEDLDMSVEEEMYMEDDVNAEDPMCVFNHVCKLCGKRFRERALLKNHINRAHTCLVTSTMDPKRLQMRVVCNVCGKNFANYRIAADHKFRLHIKKKRFNCSHCKQSFPLMFHLKQHKKKKHGRPHATAARNRQPPAPESDAPVECQICKQVFDNHKLRVSHLRDTHSVMLKSGKGCGKMVRFYKCDFCKKMCSHLGNLVRHKERNHNACQTCNENFDNLEDLKTHCRESAHNLREKDVSDYPVECQICKEVLPNSNLRTSHLNDTHSVMQELEKEPGKMVRFYKCDFCTKMCMHLGNLVRHKAKHHNACQTCNENFKNVEDLRIHYRQSAHNLSRKKATVLISQKPPKSKAAFVKKIPSKPKAQKETNAQQLSETQETFDSESGFKHVCKLCDKRLLSNFLLQGHIQKAHTRFVNSDMYPTRQLARVVCDVCDKNFADYNIAAHHKLLLHSKNTRFSCFHCKQDFALMIHFKQHMKIEHGGPDALVDCNQQLLESQKTFDSESECKITGGETRIMKVGESKKCLQDGGKGDGYKILTRLLGHKEQQVQESSSKDKTNKITEVPDSGGDDGQLPGSDLEPETDQKKHDTNDPPEQCQICKRVFTNRKLRLIHLKDTHSVVLKSKEGSRKTVRFYKCDFCTKMCSHLGNLVRHKEANHHACQTCNENFEDFEALKTHCHQSSHNLSRKKPFVSKTPPEPKAQKGTDDLQLFESQGTFALGSSSENVCKLCGEGFLSNFLLRDHIHTAHTRFYSSGTDPKKLLARVVCDVCDKKFVCYATAAKHMLRIHTEKECFSCFHCKQDFTLMFHLKEHMKEKHGNQDGSAVCNQQLPECQETFDSESDKAENVQESSLKDKTSKITEVPDSGADDNQLHDSDLGPEEDLNMHDPNEPPFECPICKQLFTKRKLKTLHLNDTHSVMKKSEKEPEKMVKFYKCDFCTKMCQHLWNLVRHKETNHDACQTCNENFENFEALKTHCHQSAHNLRRKRTVFVDKYLNEPEGSESLHPCPNCGKVQKTARNRYIHRKNCRKNLVCNICGAKFRYPHEFTRHKKIHLGISEFKCDQCPKRFTTQSGLNYHKPHHSGAWRFSCSYCERKFTSMSQKLRHERIHTGERPYICEVCGKTFRVVDALNRHQSSHKSAADDFIYPCLVCGKKFKAWHLAQRHMRKVHKGGKIFACSVCDERFCTKAELRDHSVLHADLLEDVDKISSSDLSFKSPWEKVERAACSELQSSVALNQNVVYTEPLKGSNIIPGPSGENVSSSEAVIYVEQVISDSGGQDLVIETADNYQITATAVQVITELMNEKN